MSAIPRPGARGAVRVLVVDDHLVVREGAALLVRHDPTIEIAGYARTAAEAVEQAVQTSPDVILLDLRLPDMLAPEATQALKRVLPDAKVLIFTAYADHAALEAALDAGADGCLLKDASKTDLLEGIKRVARGERYVDPRIADDGHGPPPGAPRQPGPPLTAREYEVLRRVALGETNPEIAEILGLSRNTVKSYLQTAMQKLGARNRVDAIVRANEYGLL
jgi:two-component system nitrate/nitrite response regulator NarL